MSWNNPIPFKLVVTNDSESFNTFDSDSTGLPVDQHVGAFNVQRKHDYHFGVDLYVPVGTPVAAVEDGIVMDVWQFTGSKADSDWWNDTLAVSIKGASGIVVYGEIEPHVVANQLIQKGQLIGTVQQVLKKDKGRPMSMLHMELYSAKGNLLDPTVELVKCV